LGAQVDEANLDVLLPRLFSPLGWQGTEMRGIAVLCTLLGATSFAFAADLPAPAPPPIAPVAYVAPVYNWAGVYLGVNGGYGFGSSTWSDPNNPVGTSGSFHTNGGLVGGTLGVNFQSGAFVFGVEGDIDWQSLNGTSGSAFCNRVIAPGGGFIVPGAGSGLACNTESDWLGTVRGRLGLAADRVLFYATAGGAFGDVKNGLSGLPLQSDTKFGWTAGAGVEAALTENWTVKLEYLYVDLGKTNCNTTACGIDAFGAGPVFVNANDSIKFTESVVRVGVNYKFNF
jgi:outer membrane immunogenic protein